jgi:hypothetical protein
MSEESDCKVGFSGNAFIQNELREVKITRDGTELASVERYGQEEAAQRSLWVVERILRGEQAALMILHDGNYADRETLLSVVVDGQRYVGFWDEDLYWKCLDERYAFEPADIDEETVLREFYLVDELALCETILEWVEESAEERERELMYPPADELSSLYRDAADMVGYYQHHGSLEGFELSRTKVEVERFVFEVEKLPRTREYVREHAELVNELVLEFLESDPSDAEYESTIEELMTVVLSNGSWDWVRLRVLEVLAEYPDGRAWVAYHGFYSENPEVKRATARLFAKIAHTRDAQEFLEEAANESDDERTREIAREALEDADSE